MFSCLIIHFYNDIAHVTKEYTLIYGDIHSLTSSCWYLLFSILYKCTFITKWLVKACYTKIKLNSSRLHFAKLKAFKLNLPFLSIYFCHTVTTVVSKLETYAARSFENTLFSIKSALNSQMASSLSRRALTGKRFYVAAAKFVLMQNIHPFLQ